MENIRVILAVVSLCLGGLLLIIAFIRSLRKKAPATANWVFSGLFIVVGAVLWIRGSSPELSNFPLTSKSENDKVIEQTEPEHGKENASGEKQAASKDGTISGVKEKQSKLADASAPSSKEPPASKAKRSPSPKIHSSQPQRHAMPKHEQGVNWEDRIYAAIDASFDWIEEFFDQYATPVPVERKKAKKTELAELPVIEFPEIRFNAGTAELTSESQVELKILATRLTTEYPKGILEIQAYVDSVGPEAFNFVLTQARADAVRDLLVAEGMGESRIIAKGYGTGEDPALADSRIEFIVRR